MDSFLSQFTEEEIISVTGLTSEVFRHLYATYCGPLTPISSPHLLFYLFQFYKLYPIQRASWFVFRDAASSRYCSRFKDSIASSEEYLSSVIDELRHSWDARRSSGNFLPDTFGTSVTGCVDTFPIVIYRPKSQGENEDPQKLFYNGKYGCHVVKVQLVCDNRGAPMWFSGPHLGITHDLTLFKENRPPLDEQEQLLGDKAYCSADISNVLLAPFKKAQRRPLSQRQKAYNTVHRWYRATVEHSIGYIKRFSILNTIYRGKVLTNSKRLESTVKILVHASSIHLRLHPHRNHGDLESAVDLHQLAQLPAQPALPVDSGLSINDLRTGENVEFYMHGTWWASKISYIARRKGRLSVRLVGADRSITNVLPMFIKKIGN
jgi:hypothetical protein